MEKMENTEKKISLEEILENRNLKKVLRDVHADFLRMSEAEKYAISVLEERKIYICPICRKRFSTLHGFEKHFKSHNREDRRKFELEWLNAFIVWLELTTALYVRNTKKRREVLRRLEKLRKKIMKYASSG